MILVRPFSTLAARIRSKIAALLGLRRGVVFERCASEDTLGLVVRSFEFASGNKKDVKLQAEAMAAFERALRMCPHLEVTVSYESLYSGSFRTHDQQQSLYDAYRSGQGHLAAPRCQSWHEAGLAVDILEPDTKDQSTGRTPREALVACGFHAYTPNDPPHHTYRVSTATNATYAKPDWVKKLDG